MNRHVIDERGWLHEQDNVKYILGDRKQLARERGLNEYRRVELPEADLAHGYLERTRAFWADVRARWASELDRGSPLRIHREVSGKPLYEHLFPMAVSANSDAPERREANIRAAFDGYVELAEPRQALSRAPVEP